MVKYMGLFSGGKDSLSTCRFMWEKGKLNQVIYCKTGIGLKENVDYVIDTCRKYKWELNILEPRIGETYVDFVKKFGFPQSGIHSVVMSFLKWHPMRKYAAEHKDENVVFVSGRRRRESKRRMGIVKDELETPEKNMTFYSPILEWRDIDVWTYIRKNGLDLCPVYETLHMSGDCLCGAFSDLGESQLIRTFHSYMADYIESLERRYIDENWAQPQIDNFHMDRRTKLGKKLFKHLKSKERGTWGNQVSMAGTKNQNLMDNYVCSECIFNRVR